MEVAIVQMLYKASGHQATRGPSLSGLFMVYKTHGILAACILAGKGRKAFLETQVAWVCSFTWSLTAHETLPCVPQPRHG